MDRDKVQRQLDDLAVTRSLASSSGSAWQSAPHGSDARAALAANTATTGREAAQQRDNLIAAGVLRPDGSLTQAAKEAGLRPGRAFVDRP